MATESRSAPTELAAAPGSADSASASQASAPVSSTARRPSSGNSTPRELGTPILPARHRPDPCQLARLRHPRRLARPRHRPAQDRWLHRPHRPRLQHPRRTQLRPPHPRRQAPGRARPRHRTPAQDRPDPALARPHGSLRYSQPARPGKPSHASRHRPRHLRPAPRRQLLRASRKSAGAKTVQAGPAHHSRLSKSTTGAPA